MATRISESLSFSAPALNSSPMSPTKKPAEGTVAVVNSLVEKKLPKAAKDSLPPDEAGKSTLNIMEISTSEEELTPRTSPRPIRRADSTPRPLSTLKHLRDSPVQARKSISHEKAGENKAKGALERSSTGYAFSAKEEPLKATHPVDKYDLINALPYFLEMESRLYFDEKKAEKEFSLCLEKYPNEMNKIIEIVNDIRATLRQRHTHRLQDVLILSSFNSNNALFLTTYFAKVPDDIDKFASGAIKAWCKKKEPVEILEILSPFSLADLKLGNILQGTCLSSCLCQHYGNFLWNDELKLLSESFSKNFKGTHLTPLCLERNFAFVKLKSEDSQFGTVFCSEYDERIAEELNARASHFVTYTRTTLLKQIYAMKIPPPFSDILQMRRAHISDFLDQQPVERKGVLKKSDPSRKYIADLLFLRILTPSLLKMGKTPEEKDVLTNLTKVIKCLALESPNKEKGAFQVLNQLFHEFIEKHCQFFDLHSKTNRALCHLESKQELGFQSLSSTV